MESLVEIILLIFFVIPGAFIRWALSGFRKPFKTFIEGDGYLNGVIGMTVVVLLIALAKKIFNSLIS